MGNEHGLIIESLISNTHRDRVHGFVERGRQEGAEVVAGGEFGNGKSAFSKPTVLAEVSSSLASPQEESVLVSTSPKPFNPFGL
jgi:acyl-CoA reductase-like NAD-dependent aldehyde dehydrogenase